MKGAAGDHNKDSRSVERIVGAALEGAGLAGKRFTVHVTNKITASGGAKPHIDFKNVEVTGIKMKVRCGTSNDAFYTCVLSSDDPNLRPLKLFEAIKKAYPSQTYEPQETKPSAKEPTKEATMASIIPLPPQQGSTAPKADQQPPATQVSLAKVQERIDELREKTRGHAEAVRVRDACAEKITEAENRLKEIELQMQSLLGQKQGVEQELAQARNDRRNAEFLVNDPTLSEAAAKLQLAEEGLRDLFAVIA